MGQFYIATRSLPISNRLLLAVAMTAGGWSCSLEAAQFDYHLGYRAEYSDNVTRIQNEQERLSELISSAIAGLSYVENTSTLNARVIGGAAYNHYHGDVFENHTALSLDAYGEAFMMQRTLSWVAADGFRKLQIDPLLPDTPTNRQNSNSWATGPNVYLRFGPVDTVTFEGRYGQAWVDTLDIDNDRSSYAARWAHRVSTRGTLSLNYEYLNVDFEDSVLYADVLRNNYFLRTNIHDARNDLTLDLGRTSIDREGYAPNSDWLIHLITTMQPAHTYRFGFHYRREYSDTGGELLPSAAPTPIYAGTGTPSLGADVISGEPYYMENADLFFATHGSKLPWTTRAFYRDIDYEILPADRQDKGALLDVRYLFSGTSSVHLQAIYTVVTYDQVMREDRDSEIGVTFAYRMTSRLQSGLEYRRFGRKSTALNQDYTDNRFILTLVYGSRPAAR